MSILQSEIKWYKAAEMNDQTSNGGRLTATVSPSDVKNNLWPDATQAERTAGSTKYRKLFIKIDNSEDLALQDSKVFVENQTDGDDSVTIFPGTQTDTQNDLTGSERQYGCGALNADVNAGATSMSVATEGASLAIFQNGDKIRISNKADINDSGGAEEYVTITSVPSYSGDVATFNFTPALASGYAAANSRVMSVIEVGNIVGVYDSFTVTSGDSGTYDDGTYPIEVSNIAGIEQDWTLDFTSATQFNISGNTLGAAIASGTVGTGAAPVNSDYALPYFTLDPAGFGGTFQTGDTITFTTHPAAYPVWHKRIIPALANSLTGNEAVVAVDGEST